jgi:hypothetical protein
MKGNKTSKDMLNELSNLVEEVKRLCDELMDKPKINGRQLPEKTGLTKKAI